MRLTDLPGVCEKSCAADGCPFCPARDFCLKMKTAAELLFHLSNSMPVFWMYEDQAKAKQLDQILTGIHYAEKSGKWISLTDADGQETGELQCDNKTCKYVTGYPTMYCPCCGNRMEV